MRACDFLPGVLCACAMALSVATPTRAAAADVTVFAAASTGTALEEIADLWNAATGGTATLSLAGTPALARQIMAGAPADVFVAASTDWMDRLQRDGAIRPETRRDLLGNALVLVAPKGAGALDPTLPLNLTAALGAGRLAIALVDAVPAGIYGRAALQSLGVWDGIEAQVAQTDNVRSALALVALGAAPLGVVYVSDAAAEPRVSIVAHLPAESHPPIVYPAAALTSGDAAAATAFLSFLESPAALDAFRRQGFIVLGD